MCWHWHNNISNPPWQPLQLNALRKWTTYFLYPTYSVSKSFPVFQPRWLFELISSRYQLCLSRPAEQHRSLWGCVTLTAQKIPSCSQGLHCTVFLSHDRGPQTSWTLAHAKSTPHILWGLAPSSSCCASSQCSWRCGIHGHKACRCFQVWMSSSACSKVVPFRKHQDLVFELC